MGSTMTSSFFSFFKMGGETRQTAAKQSARECHERPMSLRQRPKSGLGANMYARDVSPDGYGLRLFGEKDRATSGRCF